MSFSNFLEKNRSIFDTLSSLIDVTTLVGEEVFLQLPDRKSASNSVKVRNVGNESYRKKQCEEALKYYSISVAWAPNDSEELGLAYGNRSAVLFRLEKFELCLLDVNRALKNPLPESSKQKLLTRKTDCWKRIKSANEYKLNTRKHQIANSIELNAAQKKFFLPSEIAIDQIDLTFDNPSLNDPIWSSNLDNPLLPNFSSKVKFDHNAKWGRHLVATNDIAPGEVLLIEDVSAFRIFNKELYTHCAYCTVWCEALIPCPTCSMQMFCSERCREEAFNLYHRTECKILPMIQKMVPHTKYKEDLMLVLQLFLLGTKQGSQLDALIKDPNVYDSLDGKRKCVGVQYPNDYLSILNLLWRMNDSPPNFDEKSTAAGLIFSGLRRIDFFETFSNAEKRIGNFTDIELFALFLLYHHLSLIPQYCTGLDVEFLGFGPKSGIKSIGNGITSYQSLINHSCDPNTFVLGDKRQLVFSLRPIKAGEQIFGAYKFTYFVKDRNTRREFFQNSFKMICQCQACTENWPTSEDLLKKKNKYLTSDKKIIKMVEEMHCWLLSRKQVFEFMWFYKEDELKKALEFNKKIRRYVKEPSSTIFLLEHFIIECMKKKGPCYLLSLSESEAGEWKKLNNLK